MLAREHDTATRFVDRIVEGARIAGSAKRDDLRRELLTHFDDASATGEPVEEALRRFGPEAAIAGSLRRVYRLDLLLLHLARIAAATTASLAVALLVQTAANLRLDLRADVWRLAPGFSRAAGASAALVLVFVAAFETMRRPFSLARTMFAVASFAAVASGVRLLLGVPAGFVTPTLLVVIGWSCSRLPSRTARTLLLVGAFATALYAIHLVSGVHLAPTRAIVTGAVQVVVWSSTAVILQRIDQLFEWR